MNVFLFISEGISKRNDLQSLVEKQVQPDNLFCTGDFSQMTTELRLAVKNQDIVIILAATSPELDTFLNMRKLLEDVRLILVLTQNNADLVAKGHQLRPRFLDIAPDNDFSKVGAVLAKMLATDSSMPLKDTACCNTSKCK